MAVVIRLARMGHRNRPFYRITVADSRVAATGKFLEQIGYYDPIQNPPLVKVNEAKALLWLKNGAQPSDTVRALLHRQGILEKSQLMAAGKADAAAPLKPREWGKKKIKVHKKAKEAAAKAAAEAKPAEAKPAEAAPAA